MYSFIARQPIFDTKMQTVAYELLFRDGMNNAFPDVSPEYATSRMISDQFLCIPVPRIANNHSSFINVPHQMIINGLGDTLPNEKVVIEILENAVPDDALFCAVKDMHDRGYQLALDDFTMDDEWDRFMQYISVIKFDVRDNDYEDIRQYIHRKSQLLQGIKFLAEKVETRDEFELYSRAGFALFQGFFFSRPEILRNKCLSQNPLPLSRLMMEVNRENPDFAAVERLLKTDLTLSYKIMRYVRNMLFNSHGIIQADNLTLKEMLMYLGGKELRRFVAVAALSNMGRSGISELYHLSMVRGKFCELIAGKINNVSLSYNAFICGLFSLLDVILELPMDDLIKQISTPQNVTAALCEHKGELFDILTLSLCYEKLNWEETAKICNTLNISEFTVIETMQAATKWADELAVC
ncbi:TPA: EAL and HDOD domain-containing protein [Citrobacter freundii]|nr:EAL domain-containing protein [Citrobacter freundii]